MSDRPDIPPASDVRVFVPAKDFESSRAFYLALGWKLLWAGEGLVLLEFVDCRFMLQDHYVKEWAENFMIVVEGRKRR